MSIKILVNGKERELENEISISEFLQKKNIRPEVITLELNEKIIKRDDYQNIFIKDSDTIEIVFFMGGGRNGYRLQG